jgi:hypothetical protein
VPEPDAPVARKSNTAGRNEDPSVPVAMGVKITVWSADISFTVDSGALESLPALLRPLATLRVSEAGFRVAVTCFAFSVAVTAAP